MGFNKSDGKLGFEWSKSIALSEGNRWRVIDFGLQIHEKVKDAKKA